MKLMTTVVLSLSIIVFYLTYENEQCAFAKSLSQDSIIIVPNASVVPVIDGKGDDQCWQNASWQSINQVWIPYGSPLVDSNDYYGRYKIVWSSTTHLLYFLIEIHDDIFVDGFVPGKSANIYNFDIAEVFIDDDASGGLHVFDGVGDVGKEWGTNAANAFTYHIYAKFPKEGKITSQCYASDIAGTSWSNAQFPDHSSHFPEFALRKSGNTAVWEFSLAVYNDTYKENNKEAARVKLTAGKHMGLSVAYCDNDDVNEEPKVRDNMFGSDWEPRPGNLHWMNADYFRKVMLVSYPSSKK